MWCLPVLLPNIKRYILYRPHPIGTSPARTDSPSSGDEGTTPVPAGGATAPAALAGWSGGIEGAESEADEVAAGLQMLETARLWCFFFGGTPWVYVGYVYVGKEMRDFWTWSFSFSQCLCGIKLRRHQKIGNTTGMWNLNWGFPKSWGVPQ